MMDTDGEQTSDGAHFRSFLSSFLGEVFLLESPEKKRSVEEQIPHG